MAVEIITTVLVPASATAPAGPYDLTNLATAKDELSVASNDASNDSFLSRAITQTSVSIANHCNRVFAVEAIQDQVFIQQDPYPWQVPGGVFALQLSRWPFVNSSVVQFVGNTHGTITVDGIASTAGIVAGTLVFAADGSIPSGTSVISVATNSVTLSQPAQSSTTGLSMNTGLQVIQQTSANLFQTLVAGKDFTIDPKSGWLIRLDSFTGVAVKWEAEPVTVQYQAGFPTIPDDLVDACLRLVTARFRARGRDPMIVQQDQPQLGTTRYWVGNTPGQTGAFAPEILDIIDNYRTPVAN